MQRIIETDIASVVTVRAGGFATATAGGAGDNTEVNGSTIDRDFGNDMPLCGALSLLFNATLAQDKTLSVTELKVQDSADGNSWTDYATLDAPGVVATGPAGGGAVKGQATVKVNLSSARRYVRAVFKPDLSAADTDTASMSVAWVLAGFRNLPAPA